ncbi:hypothetical protein DITRI_Ditri11bG0073100 [Diplodiscus trichospermus]
MELEISYSWLVMCVGSRFAGLVMSNPRMKRDEEDNSDQDDLDDEFHIKNRKDDSDQQYLWGKILKVTKRFMKVQNGKKELRNRKLGNKNEVCIAEARQPFWRKVPIPSSLINPYRIVIVFAHHSVWFAFSWILDQFRRWFPLTHETYLDRMSLRFELEGEPNQLGSIDVFVSTVDPLKEPPIITTNIFLSILSVDYSVEKKIDYLKDKVHPSFVKERRAMKREYKELKVRINALVAKAQTKLEEGWVITGALDVDGKELPWLVYVFCEKRFGYQHHKKACAMNALMSTNTTSLIKKAVHIISCCYEEKTKWGKEIGWIYGLVTEDILTSFKMHCRGWKSVYCVPKRPTFKGLAPINLLDRLHQVLRWALGSVEIFLSRHCPFWYGYGGKLK